MTNNLLKVFDDLAMLTKDKDPGGPHVPPEIALADGVLSLTAEVRRLNEALHIAAQRFAYLAPIYVEGKPMVDAAPYLQAAGETAAAMTPPPKSPVIPPGPFGLAQTLHGPGAPIPHVYDVHPDWEYERQPGGGYRMVKKKDKTP